MNLYSVDYFLKGDPVRVKEGPLVVNWSSN